MRIEAWVDGKQSVEAPQQQSSDNQQHQPTCGLRHHQAATETLVRAARGGPTPFLHELSQVRVGGAQRWNQTKDNTGQQYDSGSESHDRPVQVRALDARKILRIHANE